MQRLHPWQAAYDLNLEPGKSVVTEFGLNGYSTDKALRRATSITCTFGGLTEETKIENVFKIGKH